MQPQFARGGSRDPTVSSRNYLILTPTKFDRGVLALVAALYRLHLDCDGSPFLYSVREPEDQD